MNYVRCINNKAYLHSPDEAVNGTLTDLTIDAVYKVLPTSPQERDTGLLRIIDNSGEDYLYPASYFQPLDWHTLPTEEELRSLAQAWTAGTRPTAAQLQQWGPHDVLVFLQHLPRELDHASLAWLDAQLHLTGRGNYEILVEWLTIAAGSDYEPVFGRIREVLARVGRMKFLRPLFVALGKHTRTQQLGREIYDAAQATYHSLSRRVIEAVMAQWATP
jgi:hypothetical protein